MRRLRSCCFSKPNTVIWSVTNLTVGGNAKTPMVMMLARAATDKNIRVAVMTRGYKRHAGHARTDLDSALVHKDDDATIVGDEPKMISLKLQCPVYCVDDPLLFLSQHGEQYDLWVVDDSWSRLGEWAVPWWMMDAHFCIGNGRMLPIGPLRFPVNWQRFPVYANAMVQEGCCLYPRVCSFRSLDTGQRFSIDSFPFGKATVVTAIARPDNVVRTLNDLGSLQVDMIAFADHESWPEAVTAGINCVLITEKDAVKINYPCNNIYVIEVEYQLNDLLKDRIEKSLLGNFMLWDG